MQEEQVYFEPVIALSILKGASSYNDIIKDTS